MSVRQTSLLAFRDLVEVLPLAQGRVFNQLRLMGEASDRELAAALGEFDPNVVRPRRKELVDAGLVGEAGKRECSITHRTVLVWKVLS